MRRIDVFGIGLGVFLAGGGIFLAFRLVGLDGLSAGIWSQAVMVGGLVGWLVTYLFRVVTRNMTLNQQMDDYETAVLEKRLEELSPEELAALQAKLEDESA
ncbi:DUF3007 family protein [Phormidium sp. FACHB-1136]|jgi:hypothetical protein|uniref:DUF3007 family protein n=1 Tax=Phormidium sp. FACHB-1136 TaxID=2692848 RepID=UPI001685FCB7|nr:DUF3007 family protein [Phormidium sp. FACHB-1136]MBD2425976.1 DUF3007 family protein [Phormidium sp. FACHB-1136]